MRDLFNQQWPVNLVLAVLFFLLLASIVTPLMSDLGVHNWNADFSQQDTLDRWLATMFANPAFLVFPENHPSFIRLIGEWIARQPGAVEIP